ncbi:MAG: response regulator [Candidatus Omnitrophica bacterium]|nr:response regulator [Candidatus Omnitrophota bacterium]
MDHEKTKILIVDDEQDTVTLLKDVLEEQGYRVITALDGREVLPLIKDEKPSLLVLDLRMPGLDGERILERMCQEESIQGMKVFILTGFNDFDVTKERIQRKYHHLVAKYFEKPVDLNYLCDVITNHLNV